MKRNKITAKSPIELLVLIKQNIIMQLKVYNITQY